MAGCQVVAIGVTWISRLLTGMLLLLVVVIAAGEGVPDPLRRSAFTW
jgi:hypothetical protein